MIGKACSALASVGIGFDLKRLILLELNLQTYFLPLAERMASIIANTLHGWAGMFLNVAF